MPKLTVVPELPSGPQEEPGVAVHIYELILVYLARGKVSAKITFCGVTEQLFV